MLAPHVIETFELGMSSNQGARECTRISMFEPGVVRDWDRLVARPTRGSTHSSPRGPSAFVVA